jgi:acyl-coenzyme A synthetase/AMP-(fatty) acid ligase
MDQITGRTFDLIRLPNGKVIYPGFFAYVLEELEWIAEYDIIQFQLIQKKSDHIVLKLQSQKQPSQKSLESFRQFVMKKLEDVVFDIQFVNQIPASASGKRRYMISEVQSQSS